MPPIVFVLNTLFELMSDYPSDSIKIKKISAVIRLNIRWAALLVFGFPKCVLSLFYFKIKKF